MLKDQVEEKQKKLAELKQKVSLLDELSPQLTALNEQLQALGFEKEKQEETIQQLQRLI